MPEGIKIAVIGVIGVIIGGLIPIYANFKPFEGTARIHFGPLTADGHIPFDIVCMDGGELRQRPELICNSNPPCFAEQRETSGTFTSSVPAPAEKKIQWSAKIKCE